MPKQAILFLAANPVGTDKLALDREARAVQVELERSGYRDSFEFITAWAAEPLDLLRALRRLKPTVVHFSGHGSSTSVPAASHIRRRDVTLASDMVGKQPQHGLFFQDADGRSVLVSTTALQEAFGAAGASVKLVVLNACYSEAQATALLAHVECVVGMRRAVGGDAARSFAIGFYGGLGDGESVAAAYKQGCAAISLEGRPESDCPQLMVRSEVDASRLILASAPRASQADRGPLAARSATPEQSGPDLTAGSQPYVRSRARLARSTLPPAALAVGVVVALGAVLIHLARDRTPGIPPKDAAIGSGTTGVDPAPTQDAAPPQDGMARIAGARFELGIPDPAPFRSWCIGLREPAETCDQLLGRAAELHGTTQVRTFDIDRFEVTRAQLAVWLDTLLSRGDAIVSHGQIVREKDRELLADFRQCDPVMTLLGARIEIAEGFERGAAACMTFAAAADYCRSREAALPTIAQWQLAAAGREHRLLPWAGMTVSCSDAVFGRDLGGPCASEEPRAQSVDRGDRDVTPDRVHAMGGNVSEWVEHPPRTANGLIEHLAAGGSWVGGPVDLSTVKVLWIGRPPLASTIGFRCARSVR